MATQAPTGPRLDPKKLDKIKELFQKQLDQGLHPGAAMAVYHYGKPVLDLYGGVVSKESKHAVTKDTLFITYSCSKALAAFCWLVMWERGQIELNRPIAEVWPEFGKNGKEKITYRQILTHTGGFPDTPAELTYDKMVKWDAAVKAMENAKPRYQPGQVIAYHSINFGFVVGEVIRRVDGRTISQFLKDEVTGPLGIKDIHIGLPAKDEKRVAKAYSMPGFERPEAVDFYNTPACHQTAVPAANGIATARDLGRFYAMLSMGGTLDGVEIIRSGAIKGAIMKQVEGTDMNDQRRQVKLGLGFALDAAPMGKPRNAGKNRPAVFGHGGMGSCIAFADLETKLGVAILTSGIQPEPKNTQRLSALSQAVWDALG
jgi:CubicO group peptidase (beta-lactamase class C family)